MVTNAYFNQTEHQSKCTQSFSPMAAPHDHFHCQLTSPFIFQVIKQLFITFSGNV